MSPPTPTYNNPLVHVFRVELSPVELSPVDQLVLVKLQAAPGLDHNIPPIRVPLPRWQEKTFTLKEYGRTLFDLALPDDPNVPGGHNSIRQEFKRCRRKYATGRNILRLVIDVSVPINTPGDVARLPWEMLHDGAGWLAHQPNLSIVRDPSGLTHWQRVRAARESADATQYGPRTTELSFPMRILAVCAEPNTPSLPMFDAHEHLKSLTALVKAADRHIDLTPISHVSPARLREALQEKKPHIVYYVGHADMDDAETRQGYLALEHEDGSRGINKLLAHHLKEWLVALGEDRPRLFIFAACNSGQPSRVAFLDLAGACLDAGVEATVSMQSPLMASEALALTKALFPGLAGWESLDEALRQARLAADMALSKPRDIYFPGQFRAEPVPIQIIQRGGGAISLGDVQKDETAGRANLPGWVVPVIHVRGDSVLPFPTPPPLIRWDDQSYMVYVPELRLYVERFPVTRGQYEAFAAATRGWIPYQRPDANQLARLIAHIHANPLTTDEEHMAFERRLPATRITLADAQAYADHYGKSLPTPAQWRAIGWAGDETRRPRPHPWTDGERRERVNCGGPLGVGMVWPYTAAVEFSNCHPDIGIYDLVGNVSEWAYDPAEGRGHLLGGNYKSPFEACTLLERPYTDRVQPTFTHSGVGFRCIATIEQYIERFGQGKARPAKGDTGDLT